MSNDLNPWREYAEHLEYCRACAEDGVDECHEGRTLQEAARTPTAPPDRDAMGRLIGEASGGEGAIAAREQEVPDVSAALNGAIAGLQGALIFLDQVRGAAASEDATATGASRDAREWLESAARSLIEVLSTPAPKPCEEAPAPQQSASTKGGIIWANFPSYLIDHCEGETISEEGLQRALERMLVDPQYATPAPSPLAETGEALTFSIPLDQCVVLHDSGPYPRYRCLGCDVIDYGPARIEHAANCRVAAALTAALPADGKGEKL